MLDLGFTANIKESGRWSNFRNYIWMIVVASISKRVICTKTPRKKYYWVSKKFDTIVKYRRGICLIFERKVSSINSVNGLGWHFFLMNHSPCGSLSPFFNESIYCISLGNHQILTASCHWIRVLFCSVFFFLIYDVLKENQRGHI